MKVYVTGCLSTNDDSFHEVYVYDCSSNQWDCLPRSGHYYGVPHVIGGKLALLGGSLSATYRKTNKVSTFDQSTQCWVSDYPDMLSFRSRPGVVSYLEYVIVLGGGVEDDEITALDTIEILNYVENLQWKEVSLCLPSPMQHIRPTIVDDQLYIMNYTFTRPMREAYTIPVTSILQSFNRNNVKDSTHFTKLVAPVTFGAAVLTDFPMPLVFGGTNIHSITTNDVFMYDTTTKSWNNVAGRLCEGRTYATATAVSNNAIIVIGGYSFHEDRALSRCLATVELGQAELIKTK